MGIRLIGDGIYRLGSSPCKAAVHFGVIGTDAIGVIALEPSKGPAEYLGVERNGVKSSSAKGGPGFGVRAINSVSDIDAVRNASSRYPTTNAVLGGVEGVWIRGEARYYFDGNSLVSLNDVVGVDRARMGGFDRTPDHVFPAGTVIFRLSKLSNKGFEGYWLFEDQIWGRVVGELVHEGYMYLKPRGESGAYGGLGIGLHFWSPFPQGEASKTFDTRTESAKGQTSVAVNQNSENALLLAFAQGMDDEIAKITNNATPAEVFQSIVTQTEYWFMLVLDAADAAAALDQVLQSLSKWEDVLSPETVASIRGNAVRKAKIEGKLSMVTFVASQIADALLEIYVDPHVSGGISTIMHESVDAIAAATPAVVTGASSTSGGLVFGLAKTAEVLVELEQIQRQNSGLVDQSVAYAKAQIAALENVPTYGYDDVSSYMLTARNTARDLMVGEGYNVDTGRQLFIVNQLLQIRAGQILDFPVQSDIELLNQQIEEFNQIPGNWWEKWVKFTNGLSGNEVNGDYSVFAVKVAKQLGVFPK